MSPHCKLQMHGWAGSAATGRAAEAATRPSSGIAHTRWRCAGSRGGGTEGSTLGRCEGHKQQGGGGRGAMLVVVDVVAEGMAWGGGIRFEALRTGGRVVVVPSHPAVGIWGGFGS
jgi:hypothetical protein